MSEPNYSLPITESAGLDYKKHYSEFIDRAAHDLQSPLRKIAVLTERLVSKYEDKNDAQQHIQRIHACISDMRSLIEGFAGLASFIPANMHYEPCDLSQLVKQTCATGEVEKLEKAHEIVIGDLPVIEGDKQQLKQLFKKIIDNACQFRKKETPLCIKISATALDAPGKRKYGLEDNRTWYRIEITDNGIGIEKEDTEIIFNAFVRKHPKDGARGSGLGLTIARQIAENHKGFIYAIPEKDGSKFVVVLPEKP